MVVKVNNVEDYSKKEGFYSNIKSIQDFLQDNDYEKNIFPIDLNPDPIKPQIKLNPSSRAMKNKRILSELTDQIDTST